MARKFGHKLIGVVSPLVAALLIAPVLLIVPANAAGATFYVDGANLGGTCNDSNSGTALNQAWCTVQKAATTANAGDTVFVRGGKYRETVTPTNSGTAGNVINYQKYQSETPVIDGSDLVTAWSQTGTEETGGLFANGFESADFLSYSSTQGDAGNAVTTQTGTVNHGSQAMQAAYAGADPDARANKAFTASDDVYARMYFRINGAYSLNSNDTNHTIMALRTSTTTTRASVHLLKNASGQFYMNARIDSPSVTNIYTGPPGEITADTWYSVELHYKGNDAATGGGQFWLNNTLKGTLNNVNTTGIQTSRLEIGGNSTGGGGTTWPTAGSQMYVDDVKVNSSAAGNFAAAGDPHIYKASGITWTARQLYENGVSLGAGQSSLAAVNAAGKWFMDSATNELYIWTTDGTSPTTKTIEASRRSTIVDLSNRSYITLDGLTLQYANSNGSTGAGILGSASNNLTVRNSTIKDNYGAGIYFKNTTASAVQSNSVLRNQRVFGGGIRLENGSNNNLIDGNTITGNGGNAGNGVFFCGDSTCNSTGNNSNTLSNNVISNVQDTCLYMDTNNDLNVVQYNVCHDSVRDVDDTTKGGNGFHMSLGSDNNIVRYNAVYNMERHGISIRDGNASQGYVSNNNNSVYNNSLYNIGTAGTGNGIDVQGANASTAIKNNIVYGGSTAAINVDAGSTATTTTDYNLVYNLGNSNKLGKWAGSTYTTLAAYRTASGQESHSQSADPRYRSAAGADFRLLPAAPGINTGTNLSLTQDKTGATVPQGALPDMGAFEFLKANNPGSVTQFKTDAATTVATGGTADGSSMVFKFTMDSGNPTDSFAPQIELRPLTTSFSNVATDTTAVVSYSGSAVQASITVSGLSDGTSYHWQARSGNDAGNSDWASYGANAESVADFVTATPTPTPTPSPTPTPTPPVTNTDNSTSDSTPATPAASPASSTPAAVTTKKVAVSPAPATDVITTEKIPETTSPVPVTAATNANPTVTSDKQAYPAEQPMTSKISSTTLWMAGGLIVVAAVIGLIFGIRIGAKSKIGN